jgi:hypothetical protein
LCRNVVERSDAALGTAYGDGAFNGGDDESCDLFGIGRGGAGFMH